MVHVNETIVIKSSKKHKKFLIFLINKLDFISLRKIRNNDRTIEYII